MHPTSIQSFTVCSLAAPGAALVVQARNKSEKKVIVEAAQATNAADKELIVWPGRFMNKSDNE